MNCIAGDLLVPHDGTVGRVAGAQIFVIDLVVPMQVVAPAECKIRACIMATDAWTNKSGQLWHIIKGV